jgi:RNA polymerase sigma factor (sigma-70 family)
LRASERDVIAGSIRLLFEVGPVAGMTDGELLDRFLDHRALGPRASEIAFEALVDRHGPMVLRVCRGRLGDEHDAQDAFQATFLILARKARSIRDRDSAASWLQGVARRVASCARRASAVRRAKERRVSRSGEGSTLDPDPSEGELVPAVREEVGDLPEKYRVPLMLCLLDGLTHEEAAARLGWPVGTVKTRVRQAKDRLRTRLTRRGFAPTLGAILAAMTAREASALPVSLVRATAKAALRYASGKAMTAGASSASVATLVRWGIGSLLMSRIKVIALIVGSLGALAIGTAGHAGQDPVKQEKAEPVKVEVQVSKEAKPTIETPKPAEVTAEDLAEELEVARAKENVLRTKTFNLRTAVQQSLDSGVYCELKLEEIRQSTTIEDIRRINNMTGPSNNFNDLKKHFEDYFTNELEEDQRQLARNRAAFRQAQARLNDQTQRVKDLEAQLARKTTTEAKGPEPSGKAEGGSTSSDDQRIEQIETLKLDIEYLNMLVNQLSTEITTKQQSLLQAQSRLRSLTDPYYGAQYAPGQFTDEVKEKIKKENQAEIDWVEANLPKLRQDFLVKKRELRQKQQQLEGLEKSANASSSKTPPANVERRLSEVERKLDQVLKALESRPTKN